jgi:hypothetical protein
VTAEDLIELLEERPFTPLRLHLADGRVREIRHPEMAVVSESHIVIGIPREDGSRVAVRTTFCAIPNIVEVEPFQFEKPAGGNGERKPKRGGGR